MVSFWGRLWDFKENDITLSTYIIEVEYIIYYRTRKKRACKFKKAGINTMKFYTFTHYMSVFLLQPKYSGGCFHVCVTFKNVIMV